MTCRLAIRFIPRSTIDMTRSEMTLYISPSVQTHPSQNGPAVSLRVWTSLGINSRQRRTGLTVQSLLNRWIQGWRVWLARWPSASLMTMKRITFLKLWCRTRWYRRRRHAKRASISERQPKLTKPLYLPPRRDFSKLPWKRQVIKIRKLLWDESLGKCPGITLRAKLTRS